MDEIDRLQASADFWRERANAFEIALRQIEAATGTSPDEVSSERWEIAKRALDAARH